MLLTVTTTHQPATDLGFLLHKNPERLQTFSTSFGKAHVFYPKASAEQCTAALLLDIDPVGLVRGRRDAVALEHYINDRPYVASSFLSVAMGQVFREAIAGRSKERPELCQVPIPLRANLSMVPCQPGENFLRQLFEPLGYQVTATAHELDASFPQWGQSSYFTLQLEAETTLSNLLSHLYVLLPVLDKDKHYWVGEDEVEKLLRRGEGWLATHPARETIVNRYLRGRRSLTRRAMAQLATDDPALDEADENLAAQDAVESAAEAPLGLHQQRLNRVTELLLQHGARRVLDLGCGEGRLLRQLANYHVFEEIVGLDVSWRSLSILSEKLEKMSPLQRGRIKLIQGALTYRDKRLGGYDAAALVEVIEHLDPPRLQALERVVFQYARPTLVVITTPNAEYNDLWPSLPAGKMRHRDHRFEWTRAQFQEWADRICAQHGYQVQYEPLGPRDPERGAPSQMAIFTQAVAGHTSPVSGGSTLAPELEGEISSSTGGEL